MTRREFCAGAVIDGLLELDLVTAVHIDIGSGKQIVPRFATRVVSRGGSGNKVALAIVEIDIGTVDARLFRILDAVAIFIFPDIVAELGLDRFVDARIPGQIGLS